MRTVKIKGGDEREILTAMIVDPVVLGRIALRWDGKLFRSEWANTIGKWCIEFYSKHQKAPSRRIESLFRRWASKRSEDDKQVEVMGHFLSSLSEEYVREGDQNSEYLIDLAGKYFTRVRTERLVEEIQERLDTGDTEKIDALLSEHSRVEMGLGSFVDVLQDTEAMEAAFSQVAEPLFVYPGALGRFFGASMCRDAFLAFTGPEKRGKTFWLLDVAWRAMLNRRRVVFFAVGDMSQDQMLHRIASRACRQPIQEEEYEYPKEIRRPGDEKFAETVRETRSGKGLRAVQIKKTLERLQSEIRSNKPFMKLACYPNDSINVAGIRDELMTLERSGWIADVVVIDYADILAPPAGVNEYRHQQNRTWQQLRALSQERHCLVVTATQSDAKSYKAEVITRANFSEDKRKQAHVTGIIGLNQMDHEKEQGVMRLNWVVRRDAQSSEYHCIHVAGCLAIANPAVRSCN